jgi:NADPH2:quinone reductase
LEGADADDHPGRHACLAADLAQRPRDLRLITDAPVPRPGLGEVLIRVTAAGVNWPTALAALRL